MAIKRLGTSTYQFDNVHIISTAAVGGPKEGQGPLGADFDRIWPSELNDYDSFETAERHLLFESQTLAVEKAKQSWDNIDLVMGGDLLDQLATTNFAAREHQRPLIGLFSACAVFTEGLGLGAMTIAGGGPHGVLVSAASHHMAAERQFRFPIELGYQRTPTAAWTATAAGTCLLGRVNEDHPERVRVESVTFGRVVDWGSKDPNDMGTAMAPAAFDTIRRHLEETGRSIDDYDRVYTGDLGVFGLQLLSRLAQKNGLSWEAQLDDCGRALYAIKEQDVHNGGSGAGCSASVFSGFIYHRMKKRQWHKVLLVATGALFSPTTYQQGESIPCIAHAVSVEYP
ncbi:MAG: stage V sporulation protein AD [Sulfobacillus thermosulfidooxidans]|nr:MAG: stage V sporulation protein AD [Sulfobacillus thermosulfidooxidans]